MTTETTLPPEPKVPVLPGKKDHITAVRRKLKFMQNQMLKEGMHNGAHGIDIGTKGIRDRAEMRANTCFDELSPLIKQKVTELQKAEVVGKQQYDRERETLNGVYHDEDYLRLLKYNSRESKGWLKALGYLAVGLFLVTADITLALQLVSTGFSFPKPENDSFSLNHLFSADFIDVILNNWQVMFVSLGIATFTVILKVVFDRFIGSTRGDEIVREKRFDGWLWKSKMRTVEAEPDPAVLKQVHASELARIKRFELIKNICFISLFVLALLFLFLLARFRTDSQNIADLDKDWNTARGKADTAQVASLNRQLKQKRADALSNQENTFFGITLLFPVISAICLSIAGASFENGRRLRMLRREVTDAEKSLKKLSEEYGTTTGELDAWVLERDYLYAPDWKETFTQHMVHLYEYGYTLGRIRPDLYQKIPGLLRIVEAFRNKHLLYQTNQKLTKN